MLSPCYHLICAKSIPLWSGCVMWGAVLCHDDREEAGSKGRSFLSMMGLGATQLSSVSSTVVLPVWPEVHSEPCSWLTPSSASEVIKVLSTLVRQILHVWRMGQWTGEKMSVPSWNLRRKTSVIYKQAAVLLQGTDTQLVQDCKRLQGGWVILCRTWECNCLHWEHNCPCWEGIPWGKSGTVTPTSEGRTFWIG